MEPDAGVIGPLGVIQLRAIQDIAGPIKYISLFVDETDGHDPIPGLLRQCRICCVAGVDREPGSNVEHGAVADAVLVVVPLVEDVDLPLQTAAARRCVPATRLRADDGLGQREPLRLVLGRVLKVALGGHHGCHAPEALVVVTHGLRSIDGHVVAVVTGLVDQGLLDNVVVGRVICVVPVVYHGSEHSSCFPPVVWVRQVAGCVAGHVAGVVRHQLLSHFACGGFDGSWKDR